MKRFILLLLGLALSLSADSIATITVTEIDEQPSGPQNINDVQPVNTLIPSFDPTLGTLESIGYSFTDFQTWTGGILSTGSPFGTPYTVSVTATDSVWQLGLSFTGTNVFSGDSCGCTIISANNLGGGNTFTASGNIDPSEFASFTQGPYSFITVSPDAEGNSDPSSGTYIGVNYINDDVTVQLTYTYLEPAAIPEPSMLWMNVLLAAAAQRKKTKRPV